MRKIQLTIIILTITIGLAPVLAVTRGGSKSVKAITPVGNRSLAAPIGTVESLGTIEVNGTAVGRRGLLWNGDLVQTTPEASANVVLSAIGQVTLRRGALVRLASDPGSNSLSAQLQQGEINVTLKPNSSAQLEMGGQSYVLSKGASFRAFVHDGQPTLQTQTGSALKLSEFALLSTPKGEVTVKAPQQQAPRRYLIRPLNLGTNTEIRARSSRNIQVRVTDENDRPVPDAPVLFLLGAGGGSGSGGAGTLAGQTSLQATTNSQGVAQVNFNAGNTVGDSTKIQIKVVGSEAIWEGTLTIIKASPGFWSPQNSVPIFSVVGAAVGIGIYKAVTKDPVQTPPQIITRQGATVVVP